VEGSRAATLHERADVSPRSSGRRYGRVNGSVNRAAFLRFLPFAILRQKFDKSRRLIKTRDRRWLKERKCVRMRETTCRVDLVG